MRAPDGEEHDVSGVYREVVANEKLVFTWAWKSSAGRRDESLVTVLFKPDGDGTLLTLTHEQFARRRRLATVTSRAGTAPWTNWRSSSPEGHRTGINV